MQSTESIPRRQITQSGTSITAPAFLSVPEAATALRVSSMTVRRLFDSGEIPGYRYNRSRQILKSFVDGFIAQVASGAQPSLNDYSADWFARAAEGAA